MNERNDHSNGYPADIPSSGSDILRISDAQGFRQGSRAEGKRRTWPRRASGGARHLTPVKYEGTYLIP